MALADTTGQNDLSFAPPSVPDPSANAASVSAIDGTGGALTPLPTGGHRTLVSSTHRGPTAASPAEPAPVDVTPVDGVVLPSTARARVRASRRVGLSKRSRWWLVGLVGLIAVAAVGVAVGSRVRSPAQAAAEAQAPVASWVTAPVEYRLLSQTVITRGDVRPESSLTVSSPSSVEGAPIVTGVSAAVGEDVVEGQRLVEVSGRPVFAMQGAVPVYRSLKPGMTGDDVAQLQEALTRLGYNPDSDGVYGAATEEAVAAFYKEAGYEPIPSSETEAKDLAAAEQELADADGAVAEAQAAVDVARRGSNGSEVASAQAALSEANRTLSTAQVSQQSELALASQEIDAALKRRDAVGVDPEASAADRVEADLAVTKARAELDSKRLTTQNAIDAASDQVRVAQLQLNEALAPGDATEAEAQLKSATTSRSRAAKSLEDLKAATGPTVAQGEIVFVPALPAKVRQATLALGAVGGDDAPAGDEGSDKSAAKELLVLSGGQLVVSMSVNAGDESLVRPGMVVEVLDEQSNTSFPATITTVADTLTTGSDGQQGYAVLVTPDQPLPDDLSGVNVRVTITAASTETSALVVPVAAVSSKASGGTVVSVVPAGATIDVAPREIPVKTGLVSDGFVVIEPTHPDALHEGDQVVVGQ